MAADAASVPCHITLDVLLMFTFTFTIFVPRVPTVYVLRSILVEFRESICVFMFAGVVPT